MKTLILIAVLLSSFTINAQSLKELLYAGKLKSDSGSLVRKSDDLSTKIDTTTKKPVPIVKVVSPGVTTTTVSAVDSTTGAVVQTTVTTIDSVAVAAAAPKDNNVVWKNYIDELTGLLRTEVMPSKKIKDGTYSVLIEYEIGLDGQIAVNNVSVSPESSFLQSQIKERLTLTAPQLNPVLMTNGKARKATKKQMITIAK